MSAELDNLVINTIRTLSMDAVQQANSGHPGAPMGLAPVAYLLYDRFLRFNPTDPNWPNRDRFILSAGHASMLLYSCLHINGYDLDLDELKNFRQLDSKCAGHPEYDLAPGVETTTGPLGQGAANSVGMAMAERWLAARFNTSGNKLIDYKTYAILGDGCMMEGITSEAASMAAHLGLSNLIWIYDSNNITIEGSTDLAFSENVGDRFKAYGWAVIEVDDGNDLPAIEKALQKAGAEKKQPTLVIVKTHIAYGAPNKQDTASAHGAPLGDDEIAAAKRNYGWDADKKFHVPNELTEYREKIKSRGDALQKDWQKSLNLLKESSPELATEFEMIMTGSLPDGWDSSIPEFDSDSKGIATRSANGQILNAVAEKIPWLLGGSADLGPSNNSVIKTAESFSKDTHDGRNIHFGVREHAMGAMVNGMSLSGLRAYGATFMIFSDYMRTSVRLAALMNQPTLYFFTHDSIGVGEDGPTHQPIEQLVSLRAIPNLELIRPADANELAVLWKHIMNVNDHPVALALTRQNVPTIDRAKYNSSDSALKGGYILADSESAPDIILIATGSEVSLCLEAYEQLTADGVAARVVSLPSWSLFEKQSDDYREQVLPKNVTARISVEAGSTLGWERYTGSNGRTIGLDHFGESAPAVKLFEKFGLTADNIIAAARDLLA